MTNKVNGIDARPVSVGGGAAVQRPRDASSDAPKSAAPQPVEGVQITDGARQLAALERAIADVPAVNQARVEQVSKALAEGRYQVRAEHVADKLLRMDETLADARRSRK